MHSGAVCGWEQGREVDGKEGVVWGLGQEGRVAASAHGSRSLQRSRRTSGHQHYHVCCGES